MKTTSPPGSPGDPAESVPHGSVVPDPKRAASPGQKAAWASGAIADVYMANVFSYLAMPIYNVALKVDATMVGWGMGLPRIWDALADVIIGFLSDNTRSRWGRRRPYIFAGGILSGLAFALVWMPPASASPTAIGAYFIAFGFLFYTAYSIFTVPWGALGLELTNDYHDRTNVQVWKTIAQAVGGIGLGWLWWLALRIGENEIEGVRYVGLIFGAIIVLAAIVPAVFCRERAQTTAHAPLSFWKAAGATFTNRSFLCIMGFTIFTIMGLFLVNAFALYINIYHVFGGKKEAVATLNGVANTIFQLAGLGLAPVVAFVARRLGKRRTLLAGLTFVGIGFASSWWTYSPAFPYLQIASLALISPGLSCLWILGPSMLADTCDRDAQTTGLRREGMFNASYVWCIKVGISLTLVLSGYMLSWSGFNPEIEVQPTGVLTSLRLLYAIVPVVFIGAAAACVLAYPKEDSSR